MQILFSLPYSMLPAHHDSQWCVVYKLEIRFEIAAILMAVD